LIINSCQSDLIFYPKSINVFAGEAVVAASQTAQPKLRLRLAASNIPHPDKISYGGEDAYFFSSIGGGALGVADGVGGWAESGVNPAEYSSMFMDIAKRFLEGETLGETLDTTTDDQDDQDSATSSGEWMDNVQSKEDPASAISTNTEEDTAMYIDDPYTITNIAAPASPAPSSSRKSSLEDEYSAIAALAIAHRLTTKPGSATACVLRLDPLTGELDAANLGDSGFLIIRDGDVFFKSPALQHFFDCPFQFGAAPEYTPATDYVEDAAVYRLAVQPGDVIILATDGVLDNVWTRDMVALAPRTAEEVDNAATTLASLAARHALDPEYESPYSVEASKEGIDIPIWEKLSKFSFNNGKIELGKVVGGKLDDVTCVVAMVEES
jgi:protein phosphatase PTC7